MRYYENDVKLEIEKYNMACVRKTSKKKTKMLKLREYSNCHEPLSQEWINGTCRTSKQYVT